MGPKADKDLVQIQKVEAEAKRSKRAYDVEWERLNGKNQEIVVKRLLRGPF